MTGWLGALLVAVLALGSLAPVGAADDTAANAAGVEGIWQGSLDVGNGAKLRIVFNLANKGGKLSGTMDSPDQGAKGIPLSNVAFEKGTLKIGCTAVMGTYEGKQAKGGEIVGTWKQGPASLPLTVKKVKKAEAPARPQEPKPPFPYASAEVAYRNEVAKIKLAGTLTVPKGKGPHPAVLLITGSGGQDRDETIFGHKPFWVLADSLTRRGIAVLRVDDRGIGGSERGPANPTSMDFVEDVLAGITFLKSRKDIDPKRIGLMGHSEGGLIAPIVATRSKDVAYIVMLAGTGVTGEKILLAQAALIAKAGGTPDTAVAENRKLQEKCFALIRAEKDQPELERKLRALFNETVATQLAASTPSEAEKAAIDAQVEQQLAMVRSTWMRFFIEFDPAPTLQKVRCPVLAINGEKDLQVPADENLDAIKAALDAGKNRNVTIQKLPGLNHLFQTCTTGAPSEYGTIEETFSPAALKVVSDWIAKRTGVK